MKTEFGFLFWFHLCIIGIGYAAWALFDWRLVGGGMVLYYLQLTVFGDCLMTRAQFGASRPDRTRITFYYHYLRKLGIPVTNRQVVIVADYIIPPLVFISAIIAQKGYGLRPYLL